MSEKKNQKDNISVREAEVGKVRKLKRVSIRSIWSRAWAIPSYRLKLWTGAAVLTGILIAFPFFFAAIENRNGTLLNDFIVNWIPARNVSVAVFFLIWSS